MACYTSCRTHQTQVSSASNIFLYRKRKITYITVSGRKSLYDVSVTKFPKYSLQPSVEQGLQRKCFGKNVSHPTPFDHKMRHDIQCIIFGGLSGLCPGKVLIPRIFLRSKLLPNSTQCIVLGRCSVATFTLTVRTSRETGSRSAVGNTLTGNSASGIHTLECDFLQTHRTRKVYDSLG